MIVTTRLCLMHKHKSVLMSLLLVALTWVQNGGVMVMLVKATDPTQDLYCGSSWVDAFQNCHEPCPSGDDSECKQEGWSCYGYTGCASTLLGTIGDDSSLVTNSSDRQNSILDDVFQPVDLADPTANHYCGTQWIDAMLTCSKPCPRGNIDCQNGQECFAATNCDKDLEPLQSEMIMSLLGAQELMTIDETGILEESIRSFLKHALEENHISVKGAGVTDQLAFTGRNEQERWLTIQNGAGETRSGNIFPHSYNIEHKNQRSEYEVQIELNFTRSSYEFSAFPDDEETLRRWRSKRRYLPMSSSALDVSMVITGEYRPPPYLDMDMIIEDSINRASAEVVGDLRERGQRAGSTYFERVEDLRATSTGTATARPTPMPTQSPILKPSGNPTTSPSSSPTRAFEQSVQTGFGSTLYLGTSRSYGIVFEIKTTSEAPTISIEGFDIYSSSTSMVAYEIWTKEGPWQGFEGKLEEFTKISKGEVESSGECTEVSLKANNGKCAFTSIPIDYFEAVPIFGGGASRSFYITLKSKEIIYSLGNSLEGSSEMALINATPEIEIYEGAGVLMYPFDQATNEMLHYRKPRGFLGVVHYNRIPCANDGIGEAGMYIWPCDTRSPVSTFQFSTDKPTMEPSSRITRAPTDTPTSEPTKLKQPGTDVDFVVDDNLTALDKIDAFGSGGENADNTDDSGDDIIVDSDGTSTIGNYSDYKMDELLTSNIVLTLRSVPNKIMNERETFKFQEVLLEFLRFQYSLTEVEMDVISVMVWHQSLLKVKKQKQTSPNSGKIKIPSASSSSRNKFRTKTRKMQERINEFTYTSPSQTDPTNVDVEVTTIIRSTKSTLPPSTASKLLLFVMESFNNTLIDDLNAQQIFYSYFQDINGISCRLIDEVTMPPTISPTTYLHFSSTNMDRYFSHDEEPPPTMSIFLVTAMVIVTLWCFLTMLSLCYLCKARREMTYEKLLSVSKTIQASSKIEVGCGNVEENASLYLDPMMSESIRSRDTLFSCITFDDTVDYSFRKPGNKRLALTLSNKDVKTLPAVPLNPDILKSTRYLSTSTIINNQSVFLNNDQDIDTLEHGDLKIGFITDTRFSSVAKTSVRRRSEITFEINTTPEELKSTQKRKSTGDLPLLASRGSKLEKNCFAAMKSSAFRHDIDSSDAVQQFSVRRAKMHDKLEKSYIGRMPPVFHSNPPNPLCGQSGRLAPSNQKQTRSSLK